MDFGPPTATPFTAQPGKRYYLLRYPANLSLSALFPPSPALDTPTTTTISTLPATTNSAFTKRRTVYATTHHHLQTLTDAAPLSLYSGDGGLVRVEGMLAVVAGAASAGAGRKEAMEEAGIMVEGSGLPKIGAVLQPDIIRKRLRQISPCGASVDHSVTGKEEESPKKKRSKKPKLNKDE